MASEDVDTANRLPVSGGISLDSTIAQGRVGPGSAKRDGQSMTAVVASGLRDSIMKGEIAAGRRITQGEIAARFKVSRSPVREALRELAIEGFVDLERDVGARVRPQDVSELSELYLAREAIEPMMIAATCKYITTEEMAAAQTINTKSEQYAVRFQVEEYLRIDRQMHAILLKASGLHILNDLVQGFWRRTHRYRFVHLTQERVELSVLEHRMLLDAINERDASTAEDLYRIHTRRTRLTLVEEMTTRDSPQDPHKRVHLEE